MPQPRRSRRGGAALRRGSHHRDQAERRPDRHAGDDPGPGAVRACARTDRAQRPPDRECRAGRRERGRVVRVPDRQRIAMKPGSRATQAWTIARIELRRVFFARRSFWVYGLALLPSVIFFGHGLETKFRSERLARRGVITPALMDSVRDAETAEDMKKRLGKPAEERWSTRAKRVRQRTGNVGTTTHVIEPTIDARFVRLNIIRPSYNGEPIARIYEFEVYGPDGRVNLALRRPVTGSPPCGPDQGAEKAVNGSVSGGQTDGWCTRDWPMFLQVDLGAVRPVTRVIVKHASAGGESEQSNTRDFNIQLSNEGKSFTTVAASSEAGFVEERTDIRELIYFDGRRSARLLFVDGTMERRDVHRLLDFEEDRAIFAGIFQHFYLRLAIF